ncbi:hypothetical protein ZWY2020_051917 [Hordeum vulgare]|nr:hypothetical protein ZWY2020_051917 [Hordeum vulgare]
MVQTHDTWWSTAEGFVAFPFEFSREPPRFVSSDESGGGKGNGTRARDKRKREGEGSGKELLACARRADNQEATRDPSPSTTSRQA